VKKKRQEHATRGETQNKHLLNKMQRMGIHPKRFKQRWNMQRFENMSLFKQLQKTCNAGGVGEFNKKHGNMQRSGNKQKTHSDVNHFI